MAAAGWLNANNRRRRIKVGDARHRGGRRARLAHRPRPLRRDRRCLPIPSADLRLGVLHSPEPAVLDRFAADGFDLLLAGHTHGGQVCLPGYGALVTNCGIDRARASGLHRHPAEAGRWRPGRGQRALAARLRRSRHLAVGAGPVRLPAGGNAAHAGSANRLDCSARSAGCGAAWQRASFGTKRPPVQIRPPRPAHRPLPSRDVAFFYGVQQRSTATATNRAAYRAA